MSRSLVRGYLLSALLCNLPLVTEEFRSHRVLWEESFSVAAQSLPPGCPKGERGGRPTEDPRPAIVAPSPRELPGGAFGPLLCQPDGVWAGGRDGFGNRGHGPAQWLEVWVTCHPAAAHVGVGDWVE